MNNRILIGTIIPAFTITIMLRNVECYNLLKTIEKIPEKIIEYQKK